MNTQTERAKVIFLNALEIGDAGDRFAFLDRECADDPLLRREVEELLVHNERAGSFLATVPRGRNANETPPLVETATTEESGAVIGPYRLLEQLGEGGMGVVFVADQIEPIRRRVALKLIKPGMDSRQVVARFEVERQALALMDHPNIAKVLDGGTTTDGRPFFVMELVRGATFTNYCDQNHLTVRDRLSLFVQVCQAVHHAHQKGIIHRDIKPSNVLVTELDGKPVVKVIDFGIAKAIGQQLTDKTVYTRFMQLIGTPLYMSPEQAGLSGQDVDTRTDVYSLGVLLYEILTGTTPVQQARIKQVGFDELRRIICEEEPARPSARLSTLNAAASTVSANRGTDPKRLTRLVKGELDWVVMKALEKDRNRRYESAAAFAADVQCYLAGEAVQAVPPTAAYRLRKFVRRNKIAVGAASALAAVLLLAVAGLVTGIVLIKKESDAKEAALEIAKKEKAAKAEEVEKTKAALKEAEKQTRQARIEKNLALLSRDVAQSAVHDSLTTIANNRELKAADFQGLRKKLLRQSIVFLLVLAHDYERDPESYEMLAEVRSDLARLYNEIGEKEAALKESQKAQDIYSRMAKEDPHTPRFQRKLARACHDCATIMCDLGRRPEAEPLYKEAITIRQKLIELYQNARPDQWEKLAQPRPHLFANPSEPKITAPDQWEKLARGQNQVHTHDLALTHICLGLLYSELGRQPEALKHYGEALTLHQKLVKDVPDNVDYTEGLAQTLNNRGMLFAEMNKLREAEEDYLEALKLHEQLVAKFRDNLEYQQQLATGFNNLGGLKGRRGLGNEARAAFDKAIDIQKKLVARFPQVPDYGLELARSHTNRGKMDQNESKLAEAWKSFREAMDIYENLVKRFPKNHAYAVEFADCCNCIGNCVYMHNPADALPWFGKAIDALKPVLEKEPNLVLARKTRVKAHWRRAILLNELRRHEEALPDYDRAIEFDDGTNSVSLRIERAQTLVDVKQYARATAEADAVAGTGNVSAHILFQAGTVYAMSARFVGENPTQARAYADRAVELLRQSINKGYRDLLSLETDPRFDGLRNREDFRELLKKVEEIIRREPHAAVTFVNLGKALNGRGRYKDAAAACGKAIAIDAGLAEAHNTLGGAREMMGQLGPAIEAYREAVRLDENYAEAHGNLGFALARQGDLDKAVIELEKAILLRPDHAAFHNRLGVVLQARGDLDRAEAAIRKAIDLEPESPIWYADLGLLLVEKGLVPDAIKVFRVAIERDRNFADAYRHLGFSLMLVGEYEEAKAELKRCFDLSARNSPSRQTAQQLMAVCDRLNALAKRLPALLEGKDKPANATERVGFAEVCLARGFHATSARLYAELFRERPQSADGRREEAARAAARAASGPRLPFGMLEKQRTAWREQALDWLTEEVDTWEGLERTPQGRAQVYKTLTLWKRHPDFASVRDPDALAAMPPAERARWQQFWSTVDVVRKAMTPKAKAPAPK